MRFTLGRIRRTAALSAVLLAIGAGAALAQQQGSISGAVTDRVAGTPLGSVRVSVLNTNRSTLTNQQGRYTMQALPAGTYQVQAAIIGYAAVTSPAIVTPGQAATVDFALRSAAVSLDAVVVTSPAVDQPAPGARRHGSRTAAPLAV